jgi:hypothetical protein
VRRTVGPGSSLTNAQAFARVDLVAESGCAVLGRLDGQQAEAPHKSLGSIPLAHAPLPSMENSTTAGAVGLAGRRRETDEFSVVIVAEQPLQPGERLSERHPARQPAPTLDVPLMSSPPHLDEATP